MASAPQQPHEKPSMKSSLASYASARAELFAIEAKEASTVVAEKAKFGIQGGLLLLIGYVFLLVAVIGIGGALLTEYLPEPLAKIGGWPLVALLLAVVHLITGIISIKKAAKKTTVGLFSYSRSELDKDRSWMND